jgi:ubiquinone/menaquinone biosynthesis C-methylase UbiE
MDKKYWDDYYKKHGLDKGIQEESTFAYFCQNKFLKYKQKNILEIGSGNGRDARFFAKNHHNIVAVDQSHNGIVVHNDIYQDKITYEKNDFVNMDYNKFKNINVVYSRFTLHAIKVNEEDIVTQQVYDLLDKDGLFMIEVRSIKDPLCGQGKSVGDNAYITDHYRRFIDSNIFIKKMFNKGFQLCYFTEENNLSIYKDDNPYLIRVIFKK